MAVTMGQITTSHRLANHISPSEIPNIDRLTDATMMANVFWQKMCIFGKEMSWREKIGTLFADLGHSNRAKHGSTSSRSKKWHAICMPCNTYVYPQQWRIQDFP